MWHPPWGSMRAGRRYGAAVLAAAALVLQGCGEEQTYEADEFVDAVNEEGVNLRLGEPLISATEGQRVYAVSLEPLAKLPGEHDARPDDEMEDCRASADLLCYQAANVVVVLQGGGIEASQLAVAIERLSE